MLSALLSSWRNFFHFNYYESRAVESYCNNIGRNEPNPVVNYGVSGWVLCKVSAPLTLFRLRLHPRYKQRGIQAKQIKTIEDMLKDIRVVPFDETICGLTASIRRRYAVKLPDAAIAATAIHTGSTLLTRNVKDFCKIRELAIQSI